MSNYNGSEIFPGLSVRQTASLEAALRMVPNASMREGLLRNIYSLFGVAGSYTGRQFRSALEQAFAAEGLDEIAPLNLDAREYLFSDSLGVLQAAGNTSAKIVQRQAAPAKLGGAGALNANLT